MEDHWSFCCPDMVWNKCHYQMMQAKVLLRLFTNLHEYYD